MNECTTLKNFHLQKVSGEMRMRETEGSGMRENVMGIVGKIRILFDRKLTSHHDMLRLEIILAEHLFFIQSHVVTSTN